MDKNEVEHWIKQFEALPQCIRIHHYEKGHDPFHATSHTSVLNALSGIVLTAVCLTPGSSKGFLSEEKPANWQLGITTPVLGYKDTFGASATSATTLLNPKEVIALYNIWTLQGATLPTSETAKES